MAVKVVVTHLERIYLSVGPFLPDNHLKLLSLPFFLDHAEGSLADDGRLLLGGDLLGGLG